jgi:hypothetical protein
MASAPTPRRRPVPDLTDSCAAPRLAAKLKDIPRKDAVGAEKPSEKYKRSGAYVGGERGGPPDRGKQTVTCCQQQAPLPGPTLSTAGIVAPGPELRGKMNQPENADPLDNGIIDEGASVAASGVVSHSASTVVNAVGDTLTSGSRTLMERKACLGCVMSITLAWHEWRSGAMHKYSWTAAHHVHVGTQHLRRQILKVCTLNTFQES